ncbi:MAG: metalloprotease TldD, partial [Rhodobacterales bacterium]|nr:metalloprotease TldD [Rhodobacterales bacterium]
MTDIAATDTLFYDRTGMDRARVEGLVRDALHGGDDGELFLEYCQSEALMFDDGRLKSASYDTTQGFGLRSVAGETTGHAHASDLSEDAIRRAGQTVRSVHKGQGGTVAVGPVGTNASLYTDDNPLLGAPFEAKVKLLGEIDAYARGKDPRVRQVSASVAGSWQAVQIVRGDGARAADIRPLVRLSVSVVVEQDGRMESGSHGTGGRVAYDRFLEAETWQGAVDEALRQALVNLDSEPAPAGEMTVVLGPGWPGILLHEAIGHGLEGDFNRKKT